MRVDVEASEACQHIGHSGSVAGVVGSTGLAVVVPESCIRREWEVGACRWPRVAWQGHHQAMRHHRQHRHRSRFRRVPVHSSTPILD